MKSMKTGIWFTAVLLWMVVTTAQALAIQCQNLAAYGGVQCQITHSSHPPPQKAKPVTGSTAAATGIAKSISVLSPRCLQRPAPRA